MPYDFYLINETVPVPILSSDQRPESRVINHIWVSLVVCCGCSGRNCCRNVLIQQSLFIKVKGLFNCLNLVLVSWIFINIWLQPCNLIKQKFFINFRIFKKCSQRAGLQVYTPVFGSSFRWSLSSQMFYFHCCSSF